MGPLNPGCIRPAPLESRAWGRDYVADALLWRCKPRKWEWTKEVRWGKSGSQTMQWEALLHSLLFYRDSMTINSLVDSALRTSPNLHGETVSAVRVLNIVSALTSQMVSWWIKNPISSPLHGDNFRHMHSLDSQTGWSMHPDLPETCLDFALKIPHLMKALVPGKQCQLVTLPWRTPVIHRVTGLITHFLLISFLFLSHFPMDVSWDHCPVKL